MTISFIGHGYVGLVTASVFADLGNTVWVVGRTRAKIDNLNKGIMPFYEPGLEELVKRNLAAGRLKFTLSYADGVKDSKVIFICVGTPSKSNGEADLASVFKSPDLVLFEFFVLQRSPKIFFCLALIFDVRISD